MKSPLIRFMPATALRVCVSLLITCSAFAQSTPPRIQSRIPVSEVWAGHPVGFSLLTDNKGNRQYAGYYDTERNMVIASRPLDSTEWTRQILPTRVGWDSHNYIAMALDRAGQLHVSGNMHVTPLTYFRTTSPGDVTSLTHVPAMTGDLEDRVTYPQFITSSDGTLFFTYRSGESGKGINIYNKYDDTTGKWTRLLDKPLFDGHRPTSIPRPAHDGDDFMNAYPTGPVYGPDGFWHMTWVWRDTYKAETNHNLGYLRSRDLVNWETVAGEPVSLPITLATPGVTVDPVPVNGGIINGSGKLGFDKEGRVVIAYHKFDDAGNTQMYLARAENGAWNTHPITQWSHRWEPQGGGSIPFEVMHSGLGNDPTLGLYINLYNIKHGGGSWYVEPDTLALGEKIPDNQVPGYLPPEVRQGVRQGLELRTAGDVGKAPEGMRYVLRWETQPLNRDYAHEGTPPAPSKLELIVIETAPVL